MFLRAVAVIPSVQHGIAGLETAPLPALAAHLVATCAAALLLAGFWTPIAGVAMAVAELSFAFSHCHDPWIHILLGALGAALAMLGWCVVGRCAPVWAEAHSHSAAVRPLFALQLQS
jgi:uncharacterized membrane protein YphA (DoxX/SURF4 family)